MTTENDNNREPYKRGPDGKFVMGSCGRPKGARNRITKEAIEGIKSLKDVAFIQLSVKLMEGDMQAVTYVLDRILPKGRTVELEGATPEDITEALISAQITTTEARDIANALSKLKDIAELDQLRERIERLESHGKVA